MSEETIMRQAIVILTASLLVLTAGASFALMASENRAEEPVTASPTSSSLAESSSSSATAKDHDDDRDDRVGEESEEEGEGSDEDSEKKSKHEKSEDEETDEESDADARGPEIEVLSPESGDHFKDSHVAFEGKVTRGSKVRAGEWEADVSKDGHWRLVLILAEGENTVRFTAVKNGKEAHDEVSVYLDVEKEEAKPAEFTAHQKYGSCGEEVPYDVWYGTGKPGTKVFIGSEHGSADRVIGESGKWEIKVKFPEAPCGEEFKVVLETSEGHRKVYEFVRLCERDRDGGDKGQDGEK